MNKKDLYIPLNVPDNDDVIRGFGKREICIIAASFLAAFICIAAVYAKTQNMVYAIFTGIGMVAITVMIVRKDIYNENTIDKLKHIVRFSKTQKRYEYRYYNIYEK